MIAGVRGRLITNAFAETELPSLAGDCSIPRDTVRALAEWSVRREREFGPASSVRAIADGIAIPLLKILGFTVSRRIDQHEFARLDAGWLGMPLAPVIVTGWDQPLDAVWRQSILDAVRADERWSFVVHGMAPPVVGSHPTS